MRNKKIFAVALACAVTFAGTAFAAEDSSGKSAQPVEKKSADKINIPVKYAENDKPDFLVAGVVKDIAQKILPVSAEARYFAPHFDAKVQSDNISFNGGRVGLKDQLGFGNDKAPEVILRYKRTTLDYIHVHGAGNSNFGGANVFKFGGTQFGGDVHTQSDLHYLKLNFANPIVSILGTGVDWSYGLTGIYWKGKVRGNDISGQAASRSKSFGAPIPHLGLGVHAALLPSLNAYAQISGLPLGGYGHFYDFEAGIRYYPLEIVGITFGYRKIDATLKRNEDYGKMTMSGPFAGVRVEF